MLVKQPSHGPIGDGDLGILKEPRNVPLLVDGRGRP